MPSIGVGLLVALTAIGCGGNRPAPVPDGKGAQKGQFGILYVVSVSRPTGGVIRSADGRIECGTAGGTANLCDPVSYLWGETATLSAIADDGQFFQSWAGDCSGAVALGGCVLDTQAGGADKWVIAVFNPPGQLGHSRITDPSQHSPLFFAFIRKEPGAPLCTTCHGVAYTGLANAPSCTACHAAAGKPDWLQDCSFCHGRPPASHQAGSTNCNQCHPETVRAGGSIDAAGGKHMNGALDASCNACHGYPPATGAHLAHFGVAAVDLVGNAVQPGHSDLATLEDRFPDASPTTAPSQYAFGCAHCHPLDDLRHADGAVNVTVAPPGTGTSIKDRNAPAASFDAATRTCNGVYCHSTGQASPEFRTTPPWNGGPLAPEVRCVSCHDDPPSYPNGNSHGGHVLGYPGRSHDYAWTDNPVPLRGSRHGGGLGYSGLPATVPVASVAGGVDAAPMTCQTCHFDTVDPRNTTLGPDGTPVGYYYLDTGGTLSGLCSPCHTSGGFPGTGFGKTLPLRHVNGTRDVGFDPRTGDRDGPAGQSLSEMPWLPVAYGTLEVLGVAKKPTRPYWMTEEYTINWGCEKPQQWYSDLWAYCPPGVVYTPNYYYYLPPQPYCTRYPQDCSPEGWAKSNYGTIEFSLNGARYDAGAKTCSNVACHLGSSSYPDRFTPTWGVRARSCFPCHR